MPRRRTTSLQRVIDGDPRFNSTLVQKLINVIMERGKKSCARDIVYGAIDELIAKNGGSEQNGMDYFHKAFENIVPSIEVRPRRVGGSVYQIPRVVEGPRGRALAIRWLIKAASARAEKSMDRRLLGELMDAHEGRGGAIKKKTDVHKMAEANRAFSHFAW